MVPSERDRLRRRYLDLGLGELSAAAVFAGTLTLIAVLHLTAGEAVLLWIALAPLLAVLLVASGYWLLARTWVGTAPMPRATAYALVALRFVTLACLAVAVVGIVWYWPDRWGFGLCALGIWLFGVIEWINYFAVRLSYPITRWAREITKWRQPTLMRDVREGLSGPRG